MFTNATAAVNDQRCSQRMSGLHRLNWMPRGHMISGWYACGAEQFPRRHVCYVTWIAKLWNLQSGIASCRKSRQSAPLRWCSQTCEERWRIRVDGWHGLKAMLRKVSRAACWLCVTDKWEEMFSQLKTCPHSGTLFLRSNGHADQRCLVLSFRHFRCSDMFSNSALHLQGPADLSTCRGAWYSELQAITVSVMGAAAYAPFSPFFPSSPLRASNSELFTFVLRPCLTLFVTKSAQTHRKS